MNDTSVIDSFLSVFSTYIDSGFGLLGGEVGFLSSTLIVIDITIAGLFWAWGVDEDVLQRLIRKVLYVGTFAWIIGNFSNLATILFQSFAGLGLKASGGSLSLASFMQPGTVAATGLTAAQPLIDATADLLGPVGLFTNFVQIAILLLAWIIVVLAFFILAIQVFITIIEFKLVTLAGFVLMPFAFFGRTAFMAEKVLGHIVSSGIKVLVLAVITGIGTTLFGQFTSTGLTADATVSQVMAVALAALTLLGLGMFGPGIANGIVSGGPQLGAGSAAGTALTAGAVIAGGAMAARMAGGAALSAGASGAQASGRFFGGGAQGGSAPAPGGGPGPGPGPAPAPSGSSTGSTGSSQGQGSATSSNHPDEPPAWAKAQRQRQIVSQGVTTTAQTLKGGDSHGGGASPDISEKE